MLVEIFQYKMAFHVLIQNIHVPKFGLMYITYIRKLMYVHIMQNEIQRYFVYIPTTNIVRDTHTL